MTNIEVKQMPLFKRAYKKLHKQDKIIVNQVIKTIIENPMSGVLKKGDLANIYVYKFKLQKKQYLLAYEWEPTQRLLIALGVHENFYRDLKKYHA